MKKFVFVYYGGQKAEDIDESQVDAVMEAWGKWYQQLGDALVDGGNPFVSNGMKLTKDGASAIAEEEWPSKGYTIVNAKDIEEAVEMAKGNPMMGQDDDSVQIRVYECLPM